MRPIKPNARRRPLWRTVLLGVLSIVIGGAGTVAVLASLNVIDPAKLAFWRSKATETAAIPADWIPVPLSARPIPAYTMVTRDYLMDTKSGQWALAWRAPDAVPKGAITTPSKIRGRVTAREKPAGYTFVESDFLPEGTPPGVAGGTPRGKLAINLDVSKLRGVVYDLKAGDHVVLQSSTAVDMPGAGHSNSGRLGSNVVASPDVALLPKRSLVVTLVEDGVVVTPVTVRNVPTSSSSLMQGTTMRNTPVQEIVLAVDPQELAPLNEAMALKYDITCVVRSGRPASVPSPTAHSPPSGGVAQVLAALARVVLSADGGSAQGKAAPVPGSVKAAKPNKSEVPAKDRAAINITPGLDPMANVRFMEVMVGPKRQFVLFNGPGNSPVIAGQSDESAKPAAGIPQAGAVEEKKE
jgi:hypothetical protein